MGKPGRPPTSGTRHGNGKGWGGEAKGASAAPEIIQTAPTFKPGVGGNPTGLPGYRAIAREQRIDALKEMLYGIAGDESQETRDRINAANAVLNREEGLPVQRIADMRTELERMTDEQLERAIGAIRRALGGDLGANGSGAGEATVAEQVGRVSPLH